MGQKIENPLFDSIISDLFPRVVLPTPNHGILDVSIREIIYKIMLVRHGFMLVGSPLGGKTSALKVLAGVLEQLEAKGLMAEHRVEYVFIRPKAITMGQLYGGFDPVSHEWNDGVLVNMCQKHATSLTKGRKWCIFDVPVAAIWIQIMNTRPNDNNIGEIIQMNLEQAFPATVSNHPWVLVWSLLVQIHLGTKQPENLT
uniref:Dynein heavy chain hydrolytic ATP-binding dynein motor region domain-containing protein n=1 Tax=Chrysemys picta bellii TaxID=8478 RepID=A0A8C3FCL5_CHRPI